MRKLFLFLMTMFLCLSIVSADDTNSTDVNYHVDSSYTWQIHSTIDFGSNAGVGTTVNRTAQIGQDNLGVAVTKNIIPDGATLVISLADSNTFRVVNGNTSLGYTVAKTSGGTALAASDSVLEVAAGTNTGSQALYFTLTTGSGESEVAGTYTGIITYNAQINTSITMPNKGDIISLPGLTAPVRVLSINGSEAFVVGMYGKENQKVPDNNYNCYNYAKFFDGNVPSSSYEEINGFKVMKYENSTLDTVLNETYYNSLPENIKNAIIEKPLKQYYYSNATVDTADITYDSNYLKQEGYFNIPSRKVYALDIQDIIDYYGTDTLTANDIFDIAYTYTWYYTDAIYWLRSACYDNSGYNYYCNYAYTVHSYRGGFDKYGSSTSYTALPAYVIDLTGINYEVIE